jgi:hypothetical protein
MMLEELKQIDTSAIEQLKTLKHDQEVLQERLGKMDEKRGKVSDAVYERVKHDYEARHTSLEEQARPLKTSAKSEFAKLSALLERLARDLESARLGREELIFRHDLGEFEEAFFTEEMKAAETRVSECEAHVADGQELRAAFVAAFHSEAELLAPQAAVSEAAPSRPRSSRQPAESAAPATTPPAPPHGGGEGTLVSRGYPGGEGTMIVAQAVSPSAGTSEAPDATAILSRPRLTGAKPDGTAEEIPLGFVATTIGRSPANDICISDDAVSRRHAKVVMTEQGFTIVDLNSENGVWVNGERVKERLLADGDSVEIGPGTRRYVFHLT